MNPITAASFSVAIEEILPEGPGRDRDLSQLHDYDSLYGNGDGRIDFFEFQSLDEYNSSLVPISPETRQSIRSALLAKVPFFGRGVDDFSVSPSSLFFYVTEEDLEIALHFDSRNRLKTSQWNVLGNVLGDLPDGPTFSASYVYSDPADDAAVTVSFRIRKGLEDCFSPEETLPILPEEFELALSGMLKEASATDRQGLVQHFYLSGEALGWLKDLLHKSHPHWTAQFLQALLSRKGHDGYREDKRIIWIVDQLWSSLTQTESQISQATRILQEISAGDFHPFQAFLMVRSYLNNPEYFEAFMAALPFELSENLRGMLGSIELENASQILSYPSIRLPESLPGLPGEDIRQIREAMARSETEARDELESRRQGYDSRRGSAQERVREQKGEGNYINCTETAWERVLGNLNPSDLLKGDQETPSIYDEEDLTPLYQELLWQLGNLGDGQVWEGHFTTDADPFPRRLAALSSDLRFTDQILEGNCRGWFYAENYSADFYSAQFEWLEETPPILDETRERVRRDYEQLSHGGYILKYYEGYVGAGEGLVVEHAVVIEGSRPTSWMFLDPIGDWFRRVYDLKTHDLFELRSADAGHREVLVESGGRTARARIKVTSPFEFEDGCFVFPGDYQQQIDFSWPDGSMDRWERVNDINPVPIVRRLLEGLKNQR